MSNSATGQALDHSAEIGGQRQRALPSEDPSRRPIASRFPSGLRSPGLHPMSLPMTRLFLRALLISVGLVAISGTAIAQEAPPEPVTIPDLVFPVAGPYQPGFDTFGDCRDGCARTHEGVDIMAAKLTPVVAVADGFVTSVRGLNPDGSPVPRGHQWLIIDHGGWQRSEERRVGKECGGRGWREQ